MEKEKKNKNKNRTYLNPCQMLKITWSNNREDEEQFNPKLHPSKYRVQRQRNHFAQCE